MRPSSRPRTRPTGPIASEATQWGHLRRSRAVSGRSTAGRPPNERSATAERDRRERLGPRTASSRAKRARARRSFGLPATAGSREPERAVSAATPEVRSVERSETYLCGERGAERDGLLIEKESPYAPDCRIAGGCQDGRTVRRTPGKRVPFRDSGFESQSWRPIGSLTPAGLNWRNHLDALRFW